MLRVAATLLALLAVLPAVTPMLGGYKVFSECRNLTHLGPGKWPQTPSKPYNFTGLLVMPKTTCSCSLVTATFLLSCSLCRLWRDKLDFSNDIEEDGSEVRLGTIQGEISPHLYQRQLVKKYYHCEKTEKEILKNPLMLVEVQEPFEGWSEENYPGYFRNTPLSQSRLGMIVDVVGYENSVNLPIYHQAVFDANIVVYNTQCKKFGKKIWDLSADAVCTWDVSPVRTVCNIDRGGPIVTKKNVVGIIIGFVDDTRTSEEYCGVGRMHYNVFLILENYADWLRKITGGQAKIVNLVDGRVIEDCENEYQGGGKPVATVPPPPKHTTKRPKQGRSAAEKQMPSASPLLLAAAATIAGLMNQY